MGWAGSEHLQSVGWWTAPIPMSEGSDATAEEQNGIHESTVQQNTYVLVYLISMAVSVLIFVIYW